MTDTTTTDPTTGPDAGFLAPTSMESDPDVLFPGDRGTLDADVRRVLARLLQRRFLLAGRHRDDWAVLIGNQERIESRLNDIFIRLVVDHERGVAYKEQVRSDDLPIPILLRDDAYTRAETLVLVHLRVIYQRESTAGVSHVYVDIEDIEQTVLTYFTEDDGDTARRQRAIRGAMERLSTDGVVEDESERRYRITPLVEIVLSSERLRDLDAWLRDQTSQSDRARIPTTATPDADDPADHTTTTVADTATADEEGDAS